MEVLITGGTGFIGSRLALQCLERGDSVSALGQENTAAEASNKKLIEASGARVTLASVTDKKKVFDAVRGVDVVYHLAAAQHEANVPDQHFWDVNVAGTNNVLEASVASGAKRFVHGSTIGVYGSALQGTLSENSALKPDNIYGVTKLEAENLVFSAADRLPMVVIRISETYGPGDWRLLKLFRAIKRRKFFMIGSGTNLHHPIYIDDLVDGLRLAASAEQGIGRILLLPGKQPVTTNELVETIANQLGTTVRNFHVPLQPVLITAAILGKGLGALGIQPPIHPRRMDFFRKSFDFSPDEATRALGFTAKTAIECGVQESAKWYRRMGYL